MLESEIQRHSARHIRVTLSGEIDAATAPETFRHLVETGPQPGDHVDVNLADVEFMDSRGVAMLLRAKAYFDARGCVLAIAGVSPSVDRLLRRVGLVDTFALDDTYQREPHAPR